MGEIIVSMDRDLQSDPKGISRLISKLEHSYDIVSGWRKDRKRPSGKRIYSVREVLG